MTAAAAADDDDMTQQMMQTTVLNLVHCVWASHFSYVRCTWLGLLGFFWSVPLLLYSCWMTTRTMCCFTWLLASRPFRRCAPASTSSTTCRKSRRRKRSSIDDVVRSSTLSGAGPLLNAADLPVQPLTEREIIVLVQSWKSIQKQFIDTGVSMFLRYKHICYSLAYLMWHCWQGRRMPLRINRIKMEHAPVQMRVWGKCHLLQKGPLSPWNFLQSICKTGYAIMGLLSFLLSSLCHLMLKNSTLVNSKASAINNVKCYALLVTCYYYIIWVCFCYKR